jgi:NAD(P)-dependent dehydrogenase (short-subunit alcohol dehydrogenase family)
LNRLDGKVAVITGGNSGIGLAGAKLFVEQGAFVFITGRRQAELDQAVASIGKNVQAVQGDVSNMDDVDRIFEAVKAKHPKIDIMFANAGLGAGRLALGSITEPHFDIILCQCEGNAFHGSESAPADERGRIDYSYRLYNNPDGHARVQRVQRK